MKLIRSKKVESFPPGETFKVRKISKEEFILRVKEEIPNIFAEGVSLKDPEKFSDILEMINNVCEIINIDWYECSKIKSSKRWSEGSYNCFMIAEKDQTD